jgi:hypothetical protein
MTRDSFVWWVGLIGAIVTGLAASADLFPLEWKPYITVAALVIGSVSGWMKTSPLVGENDAKKVDVSKIISALLIAFVSLGLLTGATCHGTQSPRHDATLNLQVLTSSLRALQDSEQSLYRAQTIPQLTPDAHKAFNAKMVEVWDATSAAVSVVQAWRPGEPMPAQLAALIEKTRVAVEAAAAVFGAYVPQKITDVWRAIADILLQTLGGAK